MLLLGDAELLLQLLLPLCCLLPLLYGLPLAALQLLPLMLDHSAAARALLGAVVGVAWPLCMALLLALLLLYVHAAMGFYLLGTTVGGDACASLAECLATTLRQSGMRPWGWLSAPPPVSPPSLLQVALAVSAFFSVGVLALGLAMAALLAGVGAARRREERTRAALEALAQRGESARRPLRYLSFLLSLHQKAALGEMLSSLQSSVVQRTARSDLGWIPHQVFVFPPEAVRLDLHHKQE